MVNARNFMYLRPGNLYKDFTVEQNDQQVLSTGRVVENIKGDGSLIIKACLAKATDKDIANHSIENHIVTHTIIQQGAPQAKVKDKLVMNDRVFYITDIDDCGALNIATIYYAEERNDVK